MQMSTYVWDGFKRQDGRLGIRNKLLVIYTVECSHHVADEIARRMDCEEVEVVGFQGCTDNAYAVRMLIALIRHPNVGAVLTVGLGCEYVQPEWLCQIARREGKAGEWMFVQEAGGTVRAIEKGIGYCKRMLEQLALVPKAPMGPADLVVGAECGGSDFTSGLAGNVVVGRFFDKLVEEKGTAIFEEIVEAVGLLDSLEKRAATDTARSQIRYTYQKALAYCKSVRQYSVSPGNFTGGLSTIEEKSMGAVAKSGTKPIQGVIKVSERPKHPGLWLLDSTPDPHWMQFGITNPNDNEGLMDLISCGAHLVFLVTGTGNVVGSAVAPVIKITGNSRTYARMKEDIDLDVGAVLRGECSQDELAWKLAEMVAETAAGKKTKAEILGHKEYFIPYKYQDKSVGAVRTCDQSDTPQQATEHQTCSPAELRGI